MLISEALSYGQQSLSIVTENAGLEAQWLLEWVIQKDRLYILLNGDKSLTTGQEQQLREAFEKRVSGVPMQYITGEQEFMGLPFKVGPNVLIPRRDTECIVEAVLLQLEALEGEQLLLVDLGAGSGAIGLSVAHFSSRVKVTEVDLSEGAIIQTLENRKRLELEHKVDVVHADMFDYLSQLPQNALDVIVSNPPYIPDDDIETLQTEVKCHEPRMALAGGEDGLDFYRRLVKEGHRVLKTGGFMMFEVGHDQAEAVSQLFLDEGVYDTIKCYKDLQGIERAVSAYKRTSGV